MPDSIWIKDLKIILDKPTEFFPTKIQTTEEKLNSIVRFSLYASIALSLYYSDVKYITVFFFVLFLTYIIYSNYPKVESLEGTATARAPMAPTVNSLIGTTSVASNCTRPTKDNPFMNATMKDFMNFDKDGNIIDRAPACDPTEPEIKSQVNAAFNNNLYKDVSDVFGKMNSQRNYFTMPWTTIPNDQEKFANWLYKNPDTCKENQDACIGQNYEDLRSNRFIFPQPEMEVVSTKRNERSNEVTK